MHDFNTVARLREPVFDAWLAAVRARVGKAGGVPTPVLVDTLPAFYEHLAALISGAASTWVRSTIATEHGGERARLTYFDAEAVIHEFQLFRAVVFEVWAARGIELSRDESGLVNSAVDEAIRDSVTGFVMIQTKFREQFFSALAHDMRTPLGTATMALGLLGRREQDGRARELLAVIERQHSLLAQMITDVLDMTVMNAEGGAQLAFAPLDVHSLVDRVVADAALASGRAISHDGGPLEAVWCASAIRRAVENLINNAIKYSFRDTPIQVRTAAFGGRVIVSVSNLGPPIPEDQVEAIFQLFRRAERARNSAAGGWGIGLPYVRSVAERHCGSIGVDSGASGTRFTLDLPADPRTLVAAAQQASPASW